MKIGQQIAIAALAIGSFAAGYGVSFLRFDSREADEAYINYMRQCVFLGDTEDQCAARSIVTLTGRIFGMSSGTRPDGRHEGDPHAIV